MNSSNWFSKELIDFLWTIELVIPSSVWSVIKRVWLNCSWSIFGFFVGGAGMLASWWHVFPWMERGRDGFFVIMMKVFIRAPGAPPPPPPTTHTHTPTPIKTYVRNMIYTLYLVHIFIWLFPTRTFLKKYTKMLVSAFFLNYKILLMTSISV